jgi:hypothetical protein
VPAVLDATV